VAPSEIVAMLQTSPFQPFRIVLSDGTTTYDITEPHRVLVGTRFVHVGLGLDPVERVSDRYVRLDPLHITQLIPLQGPPPQTQSNGLQVG
jgi:hypothetical protein